MRLLKIMIISKHSWNVLKVACGVVCVINVYLMMQFFSWNNAVDFQKNHVKNAVMRPAAVHPFAHLLPFQNQLTSAKKCIQPKLSLQHDALSFAFYPMKPLNCSGSNLFYLQNGSLIANKTVKNKLKICEIYAVKRESDYYHFLQKLTETSGNSSIKINEDFIFVRCHFKDNKEFDIEIKGENLKYDTSAVQISAESVLFDKASVSPNSSTDSRINSSLDEKNMQFAKYKLNSGITADNAFSHNYRVQKDVDKNTETLQPNNEDIKGVVSYLKQYKVKDSFSGPEELAEMAKSSYLNVNKEIDERQGLVQKITKNNATAKNTIIQQNINPHRIKQSRFELERNNNIKFKEPERKFTSDEIEEYYFFGDTYSHESEQNDMDQNNDTFNSNASYWNDYWFKEYDENYIEMPACEEEQFLVQVSPLKYVFDRHKITKSKKSSGLNVLMFGIDSVSNMAFRRKLPVTLNFLQRSLEAVILDGYNIVGDGTTQALLPMFLGKLQQEIPDILNIQLDNLDFVWKQYQMHGYVTMFAEDEPNLGVFNLRLRGFEDQPTDHYMRYFWQAQANSYLKSQCSSHFCTGFTPNHKYLLHYLQDFFHNYKGIPHFAVGFSGELSHNEVNPTEYLDKDLQKFLENLKDDGYLKNTVVIIFADHGSRKGKLRRLLQGKLEERLPFFSMAFPKSFKRAHSKLFANLRTNAQRLTTPFDIHETLHDLLDLSKAYSSEKPTKNKRGISLFRPIPENRTCLEAGIDTHWCACVQEKSVSTSDPVVKGAAQAVISAINNLTSSDRHQCAELRLTVIHSASIVVPNLQVLKFHRTDETSNFTAYYGSTTLDMLELQVTIETDKCNGIFEATVQAHYRQNDTLTADRGDVDTAMVTFSVFEQDISRINTYGSQSACICKSNPNIMKFCCCKKFLQKEKLNSC